MIYLFLFFLGGGGVTLWSSISFWYLFVGVFPFFCLLLLFVVHRLCVFPYFLFSLLLFFLSYFWGLCCSLCLSLWSKRRTNKGKRATTKGRNKEGQEKGRDRKPPKTKEEFWKRLFVLFPFCCLSETSSPKRCKNTEKARFSLVLSHSLKKIKHHTKTNQNKRTNLGATLWSIILGGISLLVCFRFFFVVYFFIFFVFSLVLFFFSFVLFFLSCFFWLFCFLCLFSLKQKEDK